MKTHRHKDYISTTFRLTDKQIEALFNLARVYNGLDFKITQSPTGGQHLYVSTKSHPDGWHIGQDGNVIKLGVVED